MKFLRNLWLFYHSLPYMWKLGGDEKQVFKCAPYWLVKEIASFEYVNNGDDYCEMVMQAKAELLRR